MLGLPVTPPFHAPIPASFDEIAVLAKIHRYSPLTSFLFDIKVRGNPRNIMINHIYFGQTPSASRAPYVHLNPSAIRKSSNENLDLILY